MADEPPPALVERLAQTFRSSDGNLKEMARVLVTSPEAWDTPRGKLKSPAEWIMASLRAAGSQQPRIERMLQAHALLGQPLWRPPAPKGFSDEEGAWIDGLASRLDIANTFASRLAEALDPLAWSTRCWARWRRRRRGKPSPAPRAGRRLSRCC